MSGSPTASAWHDGTYRTISAEETVELAHNFGRTLRAPLFVMLHGDLGAGKTTFTRGLALGLGVPDQDEVRSPSFTLVNIYSGRMPVYHVDLYRIDSIRDLETIGIDEILAEDAVIIVEWPEKLGAAVGGNGWRIQISQLSDNERDFEFTRFGI